MAIQKAIQHPHWRQTGPSLAAAVHLLPIHLLLGDSASQPVLVCGRKVAQGALHWSPTPSMLRHWNSFPGQGGITILGSVHKPCTQGPQ